MLTLQSQQKMADNSSSLGASEQFILIDNFLESFFAILTIHFFRKYLALTFHNTFYRFLILGCLLYLTKSLQILLTNGWIGVSYDFSQLIWSGSGATLFRLNMVWSGLLTYYLLEKQKLYSDNALVKELEIAQIKEVVAKTELEALQAKISPHFFYNVLNSISHAIEIAPDKAQKMTNLVSEFFRYHVSPQNQFAWTLKEEIRLLETYLAIEALRIGNRLEYELPKVEEQEANLPIPCFILQTLVENAVKHGVSKSVDGGLIKVDFFNNQDSFELNVLDNGVDFFLIFNENYGLKSVRQKLALFGAGPLSFIKVNEFKGVKIEIPRNGILYNVNH